MISGIFIINNHGQPRCVKFYTHVPDSLKSEVVRSVFSQVSRRAENSCNFTQVTGLPASLWGSKINLIYRHYATLFFIFACEETESTLGVLDLIQVFVETLDRCFESVCELDLIFNADKVHFVLDEIVQGGLVLETNAHDILVAINETNKLERLADDGSGKPGSGATTPSPAAAASAAVSAASEFAKKFRK